MFKIIIPLAMVSIFALPEIVKTVEILNSVAEMLHQLGY